MVWGSADTGSRQKELGAAGGVGRWEKYVGEVGFDGSSTGDHARSHRIYIDLLRSGGFRWVHLILRVQPMPDD